MTAFHKPQEVHTNKKQEHPYEAESLFIRCTATSFLKGTPLHGVGSSSYVAH
jgi:hypothetical protein